MSRVLRRTPPTTRSRSTRLRVRGVRPSWFHPPRRPPLRGICSINTSHSRAPCIRRPIHGSGRFGARPGYNRVKRPGVTPRTMTRIEEPHSGRQSASRTRATQSRKCAPEARPGRTVSLKVSEKGGVSVYGLGRFPVTLYKEQWITLLAMTDEIRAFLTEHDAELKTKSRHSRPSMDAELSFRHVVRPRRIGMSSRWKTSGLAGSRRGDRAGHCDARSIDSRSHLESCQ